MRSGLRQISSRASGGDGADAAKGIPPREWHKRARDHEARSIVIAQKAAVAAVMRKVTSSGRPTKTERGRSLKSSEVLRPRDAVVAG